MDIINEAAAAIQPLSPDWYKGKVRQVDMLRLDLLHPQISGNKWFKLKYNLLAAKAEKAKSILTFGGPFSNHLLAAAAAAKEFNISAVGIVRGHHRGGALTETLASCQDMGMELCFVGRENYARKEDPEYLAYLMKKYDRPFIIPEGGANKEGRAGAEGIGKLISAHYTHIAVSVGTGTTLAGLRTQLPNEQQILGFAPLKKGMYLRDKIGELLSEKNNKNWELFDKWHFGGFGKNTPELIRFMNEFYEINYIPLDIVYTGKMMAGVQQLIEERYFPAAARILCVHTGGLQGNATIKDQLVYRVDGNCKAAKL